MLAAMCQMDTKSNVEQLDRVLLLACSDTFNCKFSRKIAHISLFISLGLFVIMSPVGETVCQRIDFL